MSWRRVDLAKIEVLKAVKRPALWVTLGVFVLFNVLAIFGRVVITPGGRQPFELPDAWPVIIEPAINLGPLFLSVLMILLFAPEFRWKTARQNVIDGLSKTQVYMGKVFVLRALLALFFVVPIVVGTVGVILSPGQSGSPLVGPSDFNYMLGYVVALLIWGAGGFALAAVVRAGGPAVGLLFMYFIFEQIVRQMAATWGRVAEPVLDFLPVALYSTLTDNKLYYPALLARENLQRQETGRELVVLPDLWIPVVAALAYAALFLGLAFVSMRRRDL